MEKKGGLSTNGTFLGFQNVVRFHMSGNTIKFEFFGGDVVQSF